MSNNIKTDRPKSKLNFEVLKDFLSFRVSKSELKRYMYKLIIGIGLFIFFFLWIFTPFGLHNINTFSFKFKVIGGYSFFGVLALIIIFFVIIKISEKQFFSVGQLLILNFFSFVLSAFFSWLYHEFIFNQQISFNHFFYMLYFVMLTGVLPTAILITFIKEIHFKRNDSFDEKNFKSDLVEISTENTKDNFIINPNNICYVSSLDNYVSIHYLSNEKIVKKILRTTLKSVCDDLKNEKSFYRIHKSYIVNIEKIDFVKGNALKSVCFLKDIEIPIPISRDKRPELLKAIY